MRAVHSWFVVVGLLSACAQGEDAADLDDLGLGGATSGGSTTGGYATGGYTTGGYTTGGYTTGGYTTGGSGGTLSGGSGGTVTGGSGGMGTGGATGTGGDASGGATGTGGDAPGGATGTGGDASGGATGTGGDASGGATGTGGDASGGSGGGGTVDCDAATATDLGPFSSGAGVTVPSDACLKVATYPDWWSSGKVMSLDTAGGGAYPVPFTWQNECSGNGGTGTLTANWAKVELGPTSSACPTLIELGGDGANSVTLIWREWTE